MIKYANTRRVYYNQSTYEINMIVLQTVLHVPTVICINHADLSSFYIKTETGSEEF